MVETRIQLSHEDQEKLKRAERLLHDLLPLLDVADSCGVACETIRAQVGEMQNQISAIRQAFDIA